MPLCGSALFLGFGLLQPSFAAMYVTSHGALRLILVRYATLCVVVGVSILLALVPGCSSSGESASVAGKATFDSEPIKEGAIQFRLSEGEEQIIGSAEIVDGKYTIPDSDGLIAGDYLVLISATRKTGKQVKTFEQIGEGASATMEEIEQYIPSRYNSESTLTEKLEPGENVKDFNLTSQ